MFISFFRTIILYICVITAMRIMGKRQVGELDPAELVITILISDLAAIPMQDLGIPLFTGLIPIAALVSLEIIISFIAIKSRRFRRLINGQPAIIIRKGMLDIKKIRELRMTTDEVIESLRKQNVFSVSDVKYGVIEPDGTLSVVLTGAQQTVTAEMLNLTPKDMGLPVIVVSDGQIVTRSLDILKMNEKDLLNRLKNQGVSVKDVFLMTLDDCGNSFLQKKEGVR